MAESTRNMCLYLLLPEDTSCEGDDCPHPKALRTCKGVLWFCLSLLAGLGLDRLG